MHREFLYHSRDQLIALGNRLGETLRDNPRGDRPWFISLNGDGMSGKSLIPLGIDQVFRPHLYSKGVTPIHSVDALMMTRQPDAPAIFTNFGRIVEETKEEFDGQLDEFAAENPHARVLIFSNLFRTPKGDFNYAAQGLNSDRLDCNIQVHRIEEPFIRHIGVTANDPKLIGAAFG